MAKAPVPDLWPSDIAPDQVSTPQEILFAQGEALKRKTKGVLAAEIKTSEREGTRTLHFGIVDNSTRYRVALFKCSHEKELAYPVTVYADALKPKSTTSFDLDVYEPAPTANTEEEFNRLVGKIFDAGPTRAVIQSLLARYRQNDENDSGYPQVATKKDKKKPGST